VISNDGGGEAIGIHTNAGCNPPTQGNNGTSFQHGRLWQTIRDFNGWQFRLQTGTALHETGDNFAFSVLPHGDLMAIKKSGTGTKSTEVHILAP
jgi:hypothetical protein